MPTRELALQTQQVCTELGKHMGVQVLVTTGGTSLRDDIVRLGAVVHVVVATPGRILDLASKDVAKLQNCKVVIMDEADKLLSEEFQPVIEQLINHTSADRQILLYSATFPVTVKQFKDKFLRKPYIINLMEELTLKGITQFYAFVEEKQKVHCLNTVFSKVRHVNHVTQYVSHITRSKHVTMTVCCLHHHRVDDTLHHPTATNQPVHHLLQFGQSRGASGKEDHPAGLLVLLHPRQDAASTPQPRLSRLSQWPLPKSGLLRYDSAAARAVIASCQIPTSPTTDLFTRGIDVQAVNVVINFDFPKNSETYLHRVGRSGRFGHLGLAINLITYDDRFNLYKIEQELGTEIKPIPPVIEKDLYCK